MMRMFKGLLAGAILGGVVCTVDGAIVGFLVDRGAIVSWILWFAGVGAAVGGLAGAVISRLVLPPPEQ